MSTTNKSLNLLRVAVLGSLVALLAHIGLEVWEKQHPVPIRHVCQITGFNQETSLMILNCIED